MYRIKVAIKKNDMVKIITGKEKGKSGKVLRLIPEKQQVVVERVNFVKRHARPSQKMRQGGIVEKEAPLAISNLMIVCPKCSKTLRVGKKALEDGTKVRICNKCGEILDK